MAMLHREPNRVKWVGVRPGHEGTQIHKRGVATNAIAIVHTVTAGKTFYFTGFVWFARASLAAAEVIGRIRNVADVTVIDFIDYYFFTVGQLSICKSYWPPIEIAAGFDIVVYSTDATSWAALTIDGWEE
jgi:hypothetical protein